LVYGVVADQVDGSVGYGGLGTSTVMMAYSWGG